MKVILLGLAVFHIDPPIIKASTLTILDSTLIDQK
jgi:hypothetical protein